MPAELRARETAPSFAEALGLAEASGSHKVRLRWVVRDERDLAGYRVTLVAAEGLPGHLAARWWIPPTQGVPLGDGRIAYSAEISLALDGQTPVAAAIEAVDAVGHPIVLGVRRAVAEADPGSRADNLGADGSQFAPFGRAPGESNRPRGARRDGVAWLLSGAAWRDRRRRAGSPPVQPRPRRRLSPRGPPAERITA